MKVRATHTISLGEGLLSQRMRCTLAGGTQLRDHRTAGKCICCSDLIKSLLVPLLWGFLLVEIDSIMAFTRFGVSAGFRGFSHRMRLASFSSSIKYNSDFSYKQLPEETMYIVDASGLIFQTYHSRYRSLSARNSRFNEQFVRSLKEHHSYNTSLMTDELLASSCTTMVEIASNFVTFLKEVNPRYVAVVFDSGRKSFRNDKFPTYKSQRKEVCCGTNVRKRVLSCI
jgi:hypothetical protein